MTHLIEGNLDDDLLGDPSMDYPITNHVFGTCVCGWNESGMFWENDQKSREAEYQRLFADHDQKYPNCNSNPSIG